MIPIIIVSVLIFGVAKIYWEELRK